MTLGPFGLAQIVLVLVAGQRLAELAWSRRNERRLRALGAVESAAGQHRWFVALHVGWLAAMALAVDSATTVDFRWLAVYAALQGVRSWILYSLGIYWTTRILSLPAAALVTRGPYRFLSHPNYVLVAWELVVLPLAFGLWPLALLASLANLPLTWLRISAEKRALAPRRLMPR